MTRDHETGSLLGVLAGVACFTAGAAVHRAVVVSCALLVLATLLGGGALWFWSLAMRAGGRR